MAVDPGSLPRSVLAPIGADRPCHECGYNLIGLRPGDQCPECGHHIPIPRTGVKGDNLTDAPIAYLRRLALSVTGAALVTALAVMSTMLAAASASLPLAYAGVAFSLLFAAAVQPVLQQRPIGERTVPDQVLDHPRWRRVIRLSAAMWPVFSVVVALWASAGAYAWKIEPVAAVARVLFFILASASLTPLILYLAALASWAGDGSLASRLRGSAWVLVVGSVVILAARLLEAIVSGPLNGVINFGMIFVTAVYVGAVVVTVIGFLQLVGVASAAVSSNRATIERDSRVAARRAAEMAVVVERQFAAPSPVDPYSGEGAPSAEPARVPIGRSQRIERSEHTETYDLAPPDER